VDGCLSVFLLIVYQSRSIEVSQENLRGFFCFPSFSQLMGSSRIIPGSKLDSASVDWCLEKESEGFVPEALRLVRAGETLLTEFKAK